MDLIELVKPIEAVIIDPFYVVDHERSIVHFNRAFYSMLPRGVARGLKGKKCHDVVRFTIAGEDVCIAEYAWQAGQQVRLDEIPGTIAKSDQGYTFIVSALPFFGAGGSPLGVIVTQRDVTDQAQVQSKYQEMLENAKREREQLTHQIRTRTKDLLETSQRLMRTQRELMAFKRGRMV